MKNPLSLILLSFILLGCSNDISRDDAEVLIKQDFNYPLVEFCKCNFYTDFPKSYGKNKLGEIDISDLVNNNIFSVKEYLQRGTFSSSVRYLYKLSSKGKKLLQPNTQSLITNDHIFGWFPIYTMEFDEISGLKFNNPEKTSVTIDYRIKYKDIYSFRDLCDYNKKEMNLNRTVIAELYDDEWRLNTKRSGNLLPLKEFTNLSLLSSNSTTINKNNTSTSENTNNKSKPIEDYVFIEKEKGNFADVLVENLRMRESPDLNSKTILKLSTHDRVILTGYRTKTKSKVEINSKTSEKYWYKVKSKYGEGWIHGCCFTFI